MTTHMTKTWFDGKNIITQKIPESEIYKPIMTKDEALKLALEALEDLNETNSYWWQDVEEETVAKIDPAITAIKEALARPEQEPVAYIHVEQRRLQWAKPMSWNTPTTVNLPKIPLYTAPPQPVQEPVCDKDPQGCWNVRCQLGKKCKNTASPAAQPEQEPSLQEQLDEAYADMAQANADKEKASADCEKAYNEAKRIEKLIEEKNT